jgi:hypothetical protein
MRDPFADAPLSDAAFADYAAIEPMYVDGVAGVFNLGTNFGTMFFRWTPVRSEGGPRRSRASRFDLNAATSSASNVTSGGGTVPRNVQTDVMNPLTYRLCGSSWGSWKQSILFTAKASA